MYVFKRICGPKMCFHNHYPDEIPTNWKHLEYYIFSFDNASFDVISFDSVLFDTVLLEIV